MHLARRPGHRGPVLKRAASVASLVITEDMQTIEMRRTGRLGGSERFNPDYSAAELLVLSRCH